MGIRINKYLAEAGIASRREADKLVEAGVVTVNGYIAKNAVRIEPGDIVCVNGKCINRIEEKHVLAYHKPVGVTCTKQDKYAECSLTDVINYPIPLNYAGRLDKESEGLLILTNDGDLIDKMMRAANEHEKEYIVTTQQDIADEILSKMSKGVYLSELGIKTRPCVVERISGNTFRIILTQGLNRQIRRMCKVYGLTVKKLCRIRVMNIVLGDLSAGEMRRIEGDELEKLYFMVKCGKERRN